MLWKDLKEKDIDKESQQVQKHLVNPLAHLPVILAQESLHLILCYGEFN